ncbi:hypothetical protein CBM2600_U10023 [Cupriavidus taiwanensis]|nr:hypothetical protein CBM2600_U10023 [Cupriavidus taiwanensis]
MSNERKKNPDCAGALETKNDYFHAKHRHRT